MSMMEIKDIIEAPDGSTTGRIDMAELHNLTAEVRAMIAQRGHNITVNCPRLAWSEGDMGG